MPVPRPWRLHSARPGDLHRWRARPGPPAPAPPHLVRHGRRTLRPRPVPRGRRAPAPCRARRGAAARLHSRARPGTRTLPVLRSRRRASRGGPQRRPVRTGAELPRRRQVVTRRARWAVILQAAARGTRLLMNPRVAQLVALRAWPVRPLVRWAPRPAPPGRGVVARAPPRAGRSRIPATPRVVPARPRLVIRRSRRPSIPQVFRPLVRAARRAPTPSIRQAVQLRRQVARRARTPPVPQAAQPPARRATRLQAGQRPAVRRAPRSVQRARLQVPRPAVWVAPRTAASPSRPSPNPSAIRATSRATVRSPVARRARSRGPAAEVRRSPRRVVSVGRRAGRWRPVVRAGIRAGGPGRARRRCSGMRRGRPAGPVPIPRCRSRVSRGRPRRTSSVSTDSQARKVWPVRKVRAFRQACQARAA
ncbi:hypothetical protein ATK36_3271 [Amycolatopsis sulphurea]|uniref:Uncharacterized protein n=1 Tax=Amycolatopsis sulphurea TaxID=76022 RepID=A0A2A9FCP8_9PSEU|nr:hypothetical protein ATK36_3271 [Amycolatopsis sulphurea]